MWFPDSPLDLYGCLIKGRWIFRMRVHSSTDCLSMNMLKFENMNQVHSKKQSWFEGLWKIVFFLKTSTFSLLFWKTEANGSIQENLWEISPNYHNIWNQVLFDVFSEWITISNNFLNRFSIELLILEDMIWTHVDKTKNPICRKVFKMGNNQTILRLVCIINFFFFSDCSTEFHTTQSFSEQMLPQSSSNQRGAWKRWFLAIGSRICGNTSRWCVQEETTLSTQ